MNKFDSSTNLVRRRTSFRSRVSYRSESTKSELTLPTPDEEVHERGSWNSKTDYLFTCIGYAVGLGNIARFPYMVYENGGGAFVIPYIIMLGVVGIPMVFMETSLGQFSSKGPVKIWSFCPFFRGTGFAQVLLMFYVGIYYNVIISYAIFYLFASFDPNLPWKDCNNWWNTENCRANSDCMIDANYLINDLEAEFGTRSNHSWTLSSSDLSNLPSKWRDILPCQSKAITIGSPITPAEDYINEYVLGIADDIGFSLDDPVRWQNTLCFMFAWGLIFVVLKAGLKEAGKIIWFSALFPYFVLTIFLVRAATLEGADYGISYYMGPDSEWSKLLTGKTWKNAATQILFSLSAAQGGMITLSSFSKFKNDNLMDSLIICTVNSLTSIYGGFVVFSVLGFMARKSHTELKDVVSSGITLAYVSFPSAIADMPGSTFWAVLFYVMVLLLGLDTQFTVVEICTTAVLDAFPKQLNAEKHQLILTGIMCSIFFLLGLPLMTGSGIYWIILMDDFAGSWGLIFIALIEVISVAWIYGADRFIDDIKMMLPDDSRFKESKINWFIWKALWKFITPITLVTVLIWSIIDYQPIGYGKTPFPPWAQGVGWTLLLIALSLIPIMALWTGRRLYSPSKSVKENFAFYFASSKKWAPHDAQNRTGRYEGVILSHDPAPIRPPKNLSGRSSRQDSNHGGNFQPDMASIDEMRIPDNTERSPSFVPARKRRPKNGKSDRNRNNRSEYFDDHPCASMIV